MLDKIADIVTKLFAGGLIAAGAVGVLYTVAMFVGAPRTVTYCYVDYTNETSLSRHYVVKANIEWSLDQTISNASSPEDAQQKLEAMCPVKR